MVGAAAGTILDEGNRRLPGESGIVVWLPSTAAALNECAFGASHQPWLETGGEPWVRSTATEREPLYASVADVTVDTDGRRAEQVADEILGRIAEVCPEELAGPA